MEAVADWETDKKFKKKKKKGKGDFYQQSVLPRKT